VENPTATIAEDVTVNFVTSLPIDTSAYNLIAVPNEINISTPGESRVMDLYLKDTATSDPVAGQEIKALFINPNKGTLNTYTGITDANGHVVFNYTAPATLPTAAAIFTFEIAGNVTHAQAEDVTVNFVTAAPLDTTDYRLFTVPSSIDITAAGESRVLDIYLKNTDTQQPIEGQEIQAQFINPNKGTLNTYTGVTDANGHVVFNYTAPATLPTTAATITFKIAGNVSDDQAEDVTVNFVTATPLDTSAYKLIAVPDEINISTAGEIRVMDLYLKDTTGLGQPVEGQEIQAKFVNPNKGTLNTYTGITDANGHVAFNYTAPATLPTTAATFRFEIAGNVTDTKQETVTVNFVPAANYNLVNQTTPIIISSPNQEEDISVYVVDQNNIGLQSETVSISTIASGYGGVTASTAVTDAAGKATFTYQAPADLSGIDGTNRWVTLSFTKNGTIITKAVNVIISAAVPTSNYTLDNARTPVDVNTSTVAEIIDIQLNNNGIPVIDARPCSTVDTVTVDCVIYESIPREAGRIVAVTSNPLFDGYIYFSYVAPSAEDYTTGTYDLVIHYIDSDGLIAATGTVEIDLD